MKKLDVIKLNYSIDAVLRQQSKLANTAFLRRSIGKEVDNEIVLRAAIFMREFIGKPEIALNFYSNSLNVLKQRVLDAYTWKAAIKRIAAVAYTSESLPPFADIYWTRQQQSELVPCVINGVTEELTSQDDPNYYLDCTALTTAMVDVNFKVAVAFRRLRYLAATAGFTFRNMDTYSYFCRYNQLAGMRAILEIQKGSTSDRVWVGEIAQHDPTVKHNHELMKKRFPPKRKCPCNCKVPCYRCGYGLDLCGIATIPITTNLPEPTIIK
jgi:hypothetical protein